MAQKINLSVDQGTNFSKSITLSDDTGILTIKKGSESAANLSGYTGVSTIRKQHNSTNVTATMNVVITPATGVVTMSLIPTDTGHANGVPAVAAGRYVYDTELTDGANVVTRVVEGVVTINPEATQ
jgi:hypothetical protein